MKKNIPKAIAVDSSPTSPINSHGRSIRIGRRSRSKSPFRSFRWKRNSKLSDEEDDFEGNQKYIQNFAKTPKRVFNVPLTKIMFLLFVCSRKFACLVCFVLIFEVKFYKLTLSKDLVVKSKLLISLLGFVFYVGNFLKITFWALYSRTNKCSIRRRRRRFPHKETGMGIYY